MTANFYSSWNNIIRSILSKINRILLNSVNHDIFFLRTKLYHIRKCIPKYNTNFGYFLSLIKIFYFEKCAKTKDSLRDSSLQVCLYSDNKYSRTYKFGILADLKQHKLYIFHRFLDVISEKYSAFEKKNGKGRK